LLFNKKSTRIDSEAIKHVVAIFTRALLRTSA